MNSDAPSSSEPLKIDSREIFRPIVEKYDFLNHFLSLGLDHGWRRRAGNAVKPGLLLDLACGTGDLAFTLEARGDCRIVGADILPEMLELAARKRNSAASPLFLAGAGESLPFQGSLFDSVTIAFGIRNFADRAKGLREMSRVLKPGGRLVILEFGIPEAPVLREAYLLYFRILLPFLGGIISGNRASYSYLPDSVMKWPSPNDFAAEIRRAGFPVVRHESLTMGTVRMYIGEK